MAEMTEVEVAVYNIASAAFERERGAQVILVCENPKCRCYAFAMFCWTDRIETACSVCGCKLKEKESVPAL